MAFVISDLDSNYAPLEGEEEVRISLSRRDTGYCLKAVTSDGRDVGRWVSDCPLAVTLYAMLWLGQSKWRIKQNKDSLPLQKILDDVPGIAPRGIHPQQAIETLRRNFPPKPTESPTTGASIDLAEPEVVLNRGRVLTGPVADPATTMPPKTGLFDAGAIERPIREAIRSLKKAIEAKVATGPAYGRPIAKLLASIGIQEHPDYSSVDRPVAIQITNALIGEVRRLQAGEPPDHVYASVVAGFGLNPSSDPIDEELATLDAELGLEETVPEAGQQVEPRYRPLGPDEVPEGLSLEEVVQLESMTADDPSVRDKLNRTSSRAQREHDRIERAIAARKKATEAAAKAPKKPAQISAPAPAPAKPARPPMEAVVVAGQVVGVRPVTPPAPEPRIEVRHSVAEPIVIVDDVPDNDDDASTSDSENGITSDVDMDLSGIPNEA